jgi:hypothetical protein
MNNIINKCNKCPVNYNKLVTSGNDPRITESQRLRQYVNTNRPTPFYPNVHGFLDDRGLTYVPFVKILHVRDKTYIQNDIIFPRDKIYITAIQRNRA